MKDAAERNGLPMPGPNDERFWYRAERATGFQVNRHFPALVSPRIVPTYRMRVAAHGEDPSRSTSGDTSSLVKTTAAAALRSQEQSRQKLSRYGGDEVPPLPFVPSGRSEASEALCDRKPTLFDSPFDALHAVALEDYMAAKGRFLGPAVVLPTGGLARINASCEPGRVEKDELLKGMREKGGTMQRALVQEYFAKLRNFQQARCSSRAPGRGFGLQIPYPSGDTLLLHAPPRPPERTQ